MAKKRNKKPLVKQTIKSNTKVRKQGFNNLKRYNDIRSIINSHAKDTGVKVNKEQLKAIYHKYKAFPLKHIESNIDVLFDEYVREIPYNIAQAVDYWSLEDILPKLETETKIFVNNRLYQHEGIEDFEGTNREFMNNRIWHGILSRLNPLIKIDYYNTTPVPMYVPEILKNGILKFTLTAPGLLTEQQIESKAKERAKIKEQPEELQKPKIDTGKEPVLKTIKERELEKEIELSKQRVYEKLVDEKINKNKIKELKKLFKEGFLTKKEFSKKLNKLL